MNEEECIKWRMYKTISEAVFCKIYVLCDNCGFKKQIA